MGAVLHGLVVVVFAVVYGVMHNADATHFNFTNKVMDPLFLAASTSVSAGAGDFPPKTNAAKGAMLAQTFCLSVSLVSLLLCVVGGR